jgi:uncharacterized protein Yka (UPF0111/DUF47 family)
VPTYSPLIKNYVSKGLKNISIVIIKMESVARKILKLNQDLIEESKQLRKEILTLNKEVRKLNKIVEKGYDSEEEIDPNFCDSCERLATRKHDGWDLCDKCYLKNKYDE